ncbi:MAG: hypothetical protein QM767_18645 [Anaeromyxobacter sp.]
MSARALLLALLGLAPLAAGAGPEGVYRMSFQARLEAPPLLHRDEPLPADAILSSSTGAGAARLRLRAQGLVCTLEVRLAPGGALSLPAGQRCPLELDAPAARGHVLALLESGRGQVGGGRLSLELRFKLDGTVRLLERLPGLDVALPGQSDVPVKGVAEGRGEGKRDESRAAEEALRQAQGGPDQRDLTGHPR